MAQVEMRIYSRDLWRERELLSELCNTVKQVVASVHYGIEVPGPGDISLVVPVLDLELSESDADFELEISEGSDNWPSRVKGKGQLGTVGMRGKTAQEVLTSRAKLVSRRITDAGYGTNSHNIFEVNGEDTAWVQYKPEVAVIHELTAGNVISEERA